jgi:hypothetical protein
VFLLCGFVGFLGWFGVIFFAHLHWHVVIVVNNEAL